MAGVRIEGKEKLTRLADVLAGHAEAKTIRRRLSKTIRTEADPITRAQRESLARGLPKRGGAAATVAGQSRMTVRTALSGRSVGVTITDSWKGHNIAAIDRGALRHPLFRNRRHWYTTRVPSGLLTKPFLLRSRRVGRAINHDLDLLAAEIAKET